MSEHFLHHPEVRAVIEHVGGARVPQHVRGERRLDSRAFPGRANHQPDALARGDDHRDD